VTFAPTPIFAFAIPLIIAISLVYAASRHEAWPRIWAHAVRLCTSLIGVLALTTAVLLLILTQV
jgi:hypothetical protein